MICEQAIQVLSPNPPKGCGDADVVRDEGGMKGWWGFDSYGLERMRALEAHQWEVDGPSWRREARPAGQHACGNNRGPNLGDSVGKFGCPAGSPVAHGLVRRGVARFATGSGHDRTGIPRASPGGGAG